MLLKLLNSVKYNGTYRMPGSVIDFPEDVGQGLLAAKAAVEEVSPSEVVSAEVASAPSVQLTPPKVEPLSLSVPESIGKIQLPIRKVKIPFNKKAKK